MTAPNFFTRLAALNAAGPNGYTESDDPEEVFVCSMCTAEHDDEEDARDCCKPDVYTRYRCAVCRELHRSEDAAEKCHPQAEGSQPRQCPICMRSAATFQIATDCCLHTHATMTHYGRSLVAAAVASGTPWADAIAAHGGH